MSGTANAYRAAIERLGWIERDDSVYIDVRGPDHAACLHNLTTNDVKGLPVGRTCEAFVTNPQGKTLAFVRLNKLLDSIIIRTEIGSREGLLAHLAKYAIFDDVTVEDVTDRMCEFHILGGSMAELRALFDLGGEDVDRHSWGVTSDGLPILVLLIQAPLTSLPGIAAIGLKEHAPVLRERIDREVRSAGGRPLDRPAFEALRIESGTPLSGVDVTPDNLPQEIGRDDRAISFRKGCYLGQETVARLDALGHVNKKMRGLRLVEGDSSSISAGVRLFGPDGKEAGHLTSAAESPAWKPVVALGIVRGKSAEAGTVLTAGQGPDAPRMIVCDLPMVSTEAD